MKKIAYCGDCCNYCPRYIATASGSKEKLIEAALLMEKVGWSHELNKLENIKCHGCQDIKICEYGVKECCIEKNIKNCGDCIEYPCLKISNAFKITQTNAEKFKNILTKDEYAMFHKAFFLKKENLKKT